MQSLLFQREAKSEATPGLMRYRRGQNEEQDPETSQEYLWDEKNDGRSMSIYPFIPLADPVLEAETAEKGEGERSPESRRAQGVS